MKNQWLTIRQLDEQFKAWQAVRNKYGLPRAGWIKTVRAALGMTLIQLADRLGVSRVRVSVLERAEIEDAVTLRSLKEAASALECELVYAIVPKGSSTLESIIRARAEQVATERLARVAHTMSLEEQGVNTDALEMQKQELINSLVSHLNLKLWAPQDKPKRKK